MVAVAEGQLLPYETRAADNERRTVAVEVQRARQNTGWLSNKAVKRWSSSRG